MQSRHHFLINVGEQKHENGFNNDLAFMYALSHSTLSYGRTSGMYVAFINGTLNHWKVVGLIIKIT